LEHYYAGTVTGTAPGGANGPEYHPERQAQRGPYTPEWVRPEDLPGRDCRPAPLARALAAGAGWPSAPLTLYDDPVPPQARAWAEADGVGTPT
jgi:hypothetical protein